MNADLTMLGLAFTVTNAVRALFYVPQLMAVARSRDGARDIALSTWWMWTLNNSLGALYAELVLRDSALALSFAASVAGCVAILSMALVKRHALDRQIRRLSIEERETSRRDLLIDGSLR